MTTLSSGQDAPAERLLVGLLLWFVVEGTALFAAP
jgi:hypothetical protein